MICKKIVIMQSFLKLVRTNLFALSQKKNWIPAFFKGMGAK